MYKDDQVAEETEEIILKRLKNELGESEGAVQGAKLVAELAKLRNIHRLGKTTPRRSRKSRWIWNRPGSRLILTWNRKR